MIKVLIFKQENCAPCKALWDSVHKGYDEDKEFNSKRIEFQTTWFDMSNPSDDAVELAVKYNVRSAPTVVVLKDDGSAYYSGTMVRTWDKFKQLIEEAKAA